MMAAWLLGGALCVATGIDGGKPPEPDRAAYRAAATAAGRDADAHIDLALWCEARGMTAAKTRHLARAVLLDPDNARARGLLGQVKRDGRWTRPADVVRDVEESPEQRALLDEYFKRRARTADKADDQYKLALWCEENGLGEPMAAHLRRVLQLDPGREGAWRRLGFKKVGKRWVNPEVEAALKTERDVRDRAEKEWTPKLEKLRNALTSKIDAKRDEARGELAAIADPRAVPSVWKVFAKGGNESRQRVAVDVLSRIDGPDASLALATLAVYAPHASIRSDAASLLPQRDPREFAGFLAAAIRDEIKYRVKPIDGPGAQGELLVEGKDANVRRLYRPMQAPRVLPGDRIGRDANGNVILNRPVGEHLGPLMSTESVARAIVSGNPAPMYAPSAGWAASAWSSRPRPDVAVSVLQKAGVPSELSNTVAGRVQDSDKTISNTLNAGLHTGLVDMRALRPVIQDSLSMPLRRMVAEARASALIAREQLAADVAGIEAHNAPIRETNERAAAVLKAISGDDMGTDRTKWMNWALDLQGYAMQPAKAATSPPATIVENVPIAYQAQSVAIPTSAVVGFVRSHSCFAGGTPVRTLRGDRPIESILPGDRVLSQDLGTGEFRYRAVAVAFHNPPNQTFRVGLGDDSVVATGIHRFWKAGDGWIMARDLKPGDRLRTVGGSVVVTAVEPDRVQPVFNLQLIDGDSFCVGGPGLVAHDNSLVEPVAAPFDAVPAAADLVASANP